MRPMTVMATSVRYDKCAVMKLPLPFPGNK